MIGKGLFGEENKLRKLAEEAGIGDSVIIMGWIEPQLLSSYLAAADVAIYPMDDNILNRAKCPLKLIDLLSVGLPVVAERVGQVGEYIQHRKSGNFQQKTIITCPWHFFHSHKMTFGVIITSYVIFMS